MVRDMVTIVVRIRLIRLDVTVIMERAHGIGFTIKAGYWVKPAQVTVQAKGTAASLPPPCQPD